MKVLAERACFALGSYAVQPNTTRGGLRGLGLAVIAALGPVGRAASRPMIEGAVSGEGLTPAQRERLLAVGYAQAAECLPVAGINASVPLLVGGLVLVAALAARGRAGRPT